MRGGGEEVDALRVTGEDEEGGTMVRRLLRAGPCCGIVPLYLGTSAGDDLLVRRGLLTCR